MRAVLRPQKISGNCDESSKGDPDRPRSFQLRIGLIGHCPTFHDFILTGFAVSTLSQIKFIRP
jgi:hypothetical protein